MLRGLTSLRAQGRGIALWSLSPSGFGPSDLLPAYGLDEVRAARSVLFASLRRLIGPYVWIVQGPEHVVPTRPERLGVHVVVIERRPVSVEALDERAQASGFGDGDRRPLDEAGNSVHSVARYVSRHMGRDGRRLSLSFRGHGSQRVVLSGRGGGWPR